MPIYPRISDFMSTYGYQFMMILCLVCIVVSLGLCVGFGAIAYHMAKSRGLQTVPAFFAGFFGSFIALFFIAMFPKKDLAGTQETGVTPPSAA
jgi:hypothetical protein